MKLRNKIKLSFVIITVLPIFVAAIALAVVGGIQIRSIEQHYGIEVEGYNSIINPSRLYKMITNEEAKEITARISENPDALKDTGYLDAINDSLTKKFSFLVVFCGENIIYNGNEGEADNARLMDILKDNQDREEPENRIITIGETEYLVRAEKVMYSDRTEGYVYIATDYGKMFPQVKKMIFEMMIIMLLIVFLTGAGLTLWIYKGIMKPLWKLREAAKNIAEGNLDFKIEKEKEDEFGELCMDFEEMRIRLKESAEEKIRNDNESKELISNISHDLKTPITSIKGYVEGIMDGVADTPEKMDKYIRTIYNKANDMDKLIGELTEYSRIDTNKVPYNFSKVNIDEYFRDCVDELKIDLEQKGITLSYFNYVDSSTVIIADAEQFKRVINNIISNSVKYIGIKKGIINIRILDEGDFVHIEIEDSGKGIAQKDLPLIFERFYRTDSSRNSNQGGSGIGLSIAKKIIEEHSGRIWATSREGIGTTIHIVLRKYMVIQ